MVELCYRKKSHYFVYAYKMVQCGPVWSGVARCGSVWSGVVISQTGPDILTSTARQDDDRRRRSGHLLLEEEVSGGTRSEQKPGELGRLSSHLDAPATAICEWSVNAKRVSLSTLPPCHTAPRAPQNELGRVHYDTDGVARFRNGPYRLLFNRFVS